MVPLDQIPDGWLGLDHGPESTATIRSAMDGCRTVLWNGPMGVFEQPAYAQVSSEYVSRYYLLTNSTTLTHDAQGTYAVAEH